ncbi:hypothetical protein MKW92_003099, partial [Papaver armeniacum]
KIWLDRVRATQRSLFRDYAEWFMALMFLTPSLVLLHLGLICPYTSHTLKRTKGSNETLLYDPDQIDQTH